MNIETRKDISWYEWFYMVSNIWDIKSVDRYVKRKNKYIRLKWKIISKYWDWKWYYKVQLCKNWKKERIFVHRIVANSFLWNITWKVVDHIDENRKNNKVWNLQIITQKWNMARRMFISNEIKNMLWILYEHRDNIWKDSFIELWLNIFLNTQN